MSDCVPCVAAALGWASRRSRTTRHPSPHHRTSRWARPTGPRWHDARRMMTMKMMMMMTGGGLRWGCGGGRETVGTSLRAGQTRAAPMSRLEAWTRSYVGRCRTRLAVTAVRRRPGHDAACSMMMMRRRRTGGGLLLGGGGGRGGMCRHLGGCRTRVAAPQRCGSAIDSPPVRRSARAGMPGAASTTVSKGPLFLSWLSQAARHLR
jgi:hypothetical protein